MRLDYLNLQNKFDKILKRSCQCSPKLFFEKLRKRAKIYVKFLNFYILLLLVIIISSQILNAQQLDYQIENITVEEGLHHNEINSIIQDSLGFIWCGTPHGLRRYDGYEFKLCQHNPADSTTIRTALLIMTPSLRISS